MLLSAAWVQLEAELNSLSLHLRDFAALKPLLNSSTQFSVLDECILEGLLSRIWQTWGGFCRTCVIHSCLGTVDASGVIVPRLASAESEAHVSGAAIRAKQSKRPYWDTPNEALRLEPTWGDVDVLTKVLTALRPDNFAQMLAAFSSGYSSVKALQLIRNCAAHNHIQNLAEVETLRSSYIVFPITHPTQAMFWVEPQSTDFLITHAIDDLKGAALTAVS